MTPRRNLGAVRSNFAPWADPGARPLVRFEGVTRRFDGEAAVNAVTLDIYEREFFALLGPSGCGKTTLMRLLAGFETPDEGRILLAGQDIAGLPPHARPVHMMFQSYALFPHLSVARNVAFGLRQQRLPKAEIAARVAEMLELVHLQGLDARRPDQLSGGQKQRVALARALAPRPRILLLDEPLAALDKKLREETRFELMDLQRRLHLTFVIVTHDQEEAMAVADRLAVMRDGEIAQVGHPADVYELPNSRYVAEFIGDVNIFEGVVTATDGRTVWLAAPEHPEGFEARLDNPPPPGSTVSLAVRPEKIALNLARTQGQNSLSGKVIHIAYLGGRTIYNVELSGGRTVHVTSSRSSEPVRIGAQVWLSFRPAESVLLLT